MVEKSELRGWFPGLYDPFRNLGNKMADWFNPVSEASSGADAYTIAIELPGVAEQDIDITLHDGVMTIKGEKKSEREEKGETFFFSERSYGAFQRSFRLPPDADGAAVDAHMNDGVLEIRVPRHAPKEPEAKKISVRRK